MGIRTRRKRLEHFEQRADAFDLALMEGVEGVDHRHVERDKDIIVGSGQHRRLMMKRSPRHLEFVGRDYEILLDYYQKKGVKPKHYALERVKFSENTGVMEYFNTPSVDELNNYLKLREVEKERGKPFTLPEAIDAAGEFDLTRDEWFICKRFSKQNPGITLEKLGNAFDELHGHIRESIGSDVNIVGSNILVLGQMKDGKIKLAIVDV